MLYVAVSYVPMAVLLLKVIDPVRETGSGFGATAYVTVPKPDGVDTAPEVMTIHDAPEMAVHAQPVYTLFTIGPLVHVTLPVPPDPEKRGAVGGSKLKTEHCRCCVRRDEAPIPKPRTRSAEDTPRKCKRRPKWYII
jgi:hypothetical protein